ncbi:MAG: RNA methyltransferase [Bacteriovoracaceae bacterium]|nr:RNA methyltransferase [Bacteriovoracaceae bacterium]
MAEEKLKAPLYVGLVHGPVKDKSGSVVTTSVTNLDIHDISRTCRTFGVSRYFLITPLKIQHELVNRILGHWESDKGSLYNPDRTDALASAELVDTIEDARCTVEKIEGKTPLIVVTGAQLVGDGDESQLAQKAILDQIPILLLFGTGWGLLASTTDHADFRLGPITSCARDDYNHLSVRSAVAIYVDRLARSLCSP